MPVWTTRGKCPSHFESFSVVTLTRENVGLTSENVNNSAGARNHGLDLRVRKGLF